MKRSKFREAQIAVVLKVADRTTACLRLRTNVRKVCVAGAVPDAAIWHFPCVPAELSSCSDDKSMKMRFKMLRNLFGLGMILNTESFQKGQDAAREGRPETDNPFSVGSAYGSDWQLGWRLAVKMAADNENRRIASPAVDVSPYDMGRAAARDGLSAALNPYHPGHPSHDQWRLGWAIGKAA